MSHKSTSGGPGVWRLFFESYWSLSRVLEQEMLDGQGLSFAWYDVLLHLAEAPGRRIRMNELADTLVWSRSWLTRRIDQMEAAGLVRREIDSSDRRGAFAVLTRKGLATFQRTAGQHLADIERHFYAHLTESDLRALRKAFMKLQRAEGGFDSTQGAAARSLNLPA